MNTPIFNCGVFCGIKHNEGTEWNPRFFMLFADSDMLMRLAERRFEQVVPNWNKRTPRHSRHGFRK